MLRLSDVRYKTKMYSSRLLAPNCMEKQYCVAMCLSPCLDVLDCLACVNVLAPHVAKHIVWGPRTDIILLI